MAMQGDELKAARKAAKLTQGQLADAIGMTGTFIGLMERGERPIEKRTELAVRYVTARAQSDSPASIAREVGDVLDAVGTRGAGTSDQMQALRALAKRWEAAGGSADVQPLFAKAEGAVGMVRASPPGDPMSLPAHADLMRVKNEWRHLAADLAGR